MSDHKLDFRDQLQKQRLREENENRYEIKHLNIVENSVDLICGKTNKCFDSKVENINKFYKELLCVSSLPTEWCHGECQIDQQVEYTMWRFLVKIDYVINFLSCNNFPYGVILKSSSLLNRCEIY